MKRILALLLVLAMVFTLVACGASEETTAEERQNSFTDMIRLALETAV